jgi:hypothetical protein
MNCCRRQHQTFLFARIIRSLDLRIDVRKVCLARGGGGKIRRGAERASLSLCLSLEQHRKSIAYASDKHRTSRKTSYAIMSNGTVYRAVDMFAGNT